MLKIQAARRFHELLRHDRAQDARWREDREKAQAKADRKAARIDGLVRTAQARIEGCRGYPTALAVRQVRALVGHPKMPAHVRVRAAALILGLSE